MLKGTAANNKELVIASLRCLISIGHRQKISRFLDSATISLIQNLKENGGSARISKLAEYLLGIIDSGPRPEPAVPRPGRSVAALTEVYQGLRHNSQSVPGKPRQVVG